MKNVSMQLVLICVLLLLSAPHLSAAAPTPKPAVPNASPAKKASKPAVKPAPRRNVRPPVRRAAYGIWGVNIDPAGATFPLIAEEMALAEELGVSMVRFTFDWATFAPAPRNRNLYRFQAAVREAERRRLKVVGVFGGRLPDYVKKPGAIVPGAKEFDAAQFDAFLEYVEIVVKNFSSRIRCWEVGERADGRFPPDQQRRLAAAVAGVILKIDGTLTVLPPSAPEYEHAQLNLWNSGERPLAVQNLRTLAPGIDPEIRWNSPQRYKVPPRSTFWVTSAGLPGGAANYPYRYLVNALYRSAGSPMQNGELLLLADAKFNCFTEQYNFGRNDLGRFRSVRELRIAEVSQLQPDRRQLLVLPPRLELPADQLKIILDYLKRGGQVLVPHDNDTTFTQAVLAGLHVGLEKPGSYDRINGGPGCPDMPKTLARLEPVTMQGLTPYKLPPGDRFQSLVQLSSSKLTATAVGLYSYGSDFRGRLVLVRGSADCFGGGCTQDQQAKMLPRELILWRARGAAKIFYHRMTALEESRELPQHYGLLTRNQEKKSAYWAYRTLIRMMPDGSTRPAIQRLPGDLWLASWQRPDKSTVYALWSRLHTRRVRIILPPGKTIREAYNLTGQRFTLSPADFWVSDRVVYWVAAPGVKVQLK